MKRFTCWLLVITMLLALAPAAFAAEVTDPGEEAASAETVSAAPAESTAATEPTSESTAQETTEATTEPTAEATTEPTAEATTEPTTEAAEAAVMAVALEAEALVADTEITAATKWKYLDDNTDPAGDAAAAGYDRTSWTIESYDDSAWKTAVGPFGSKKGAAALESGYTAATILDGCDGSGDAPVYFFRTELQIDTLEGVTQLAGTVQYDDGLIVYINGVRVAAFEDTACNASGDSLGTAITENLQYGGSNGSTPRTSTFTVTDPKYAAHGSEHRGCGAAPGSPDQL